MQRPLSLHVLLALDTLAAASFASASLAAASLAAALLHLQRLLSQLCGFLASPGSPRLLSAAYLAAVSLDAASHAAASLASASSIISPRTGRGCIIFIFFCNHRRSFPHSLMAIIMTASLTVDSFALAAACLAGVAAASLPMASLAAPLLSQRLLLLSPRPRLLLQRRCSSGCGFSSAESSLAVASSSSPFFPTKVNHSDPRFTLLSARHHSLRLLSLRPFLPRPLTAASRLFQHYFSLHQTRIDNIYIFLHHILRRVANTIARTTSLHSSTHSRSGLLLQAQ